MSIPPRPRALVTGADGDIGAAYVDRLARLGHDVVLVAADQARCWPLAKRVQRDAGVATEVVRADLLEPADLARVGARLRDDPSIAMLVNTAAVSGLGPFETFDPARLGAIVSLNVLALARLAAAAAQAFLVRGGGTIVNVGSVAALMPETFEPVFAASQASMLALSQSLHHQLEPRGIRVQAVLAGITTTARPEHACTNLPTPTRAPRMEPHELVDAALAGLDMGESVSIPSLCDMDEWESYDRKRRRLAPFLSRRHAADRYRLAPTEDLR